MTAISIHELEKEKVKNFYANFCDLFEDIKKFLRNKDFESCYIIVDSSLEQNQANTNIFKPRLLLWPKYPNIKTEEQALFSPIELDLQTIFPEKKYLFDDEFNQNLLDYYKRKEIEIKPKMKLSKIIDEMSNSIIDPDKILQKILQEETEIKRLTIKKESLEKKLNKNLVQTKKMKI